MSISLNPVTKINTSTSTFKDLKTNFDILCDNQILLRDYACSLEDVICSLSDLDTDDKSCIVNAINEIHFELDELSGDLATQISNIASQIVYESLLDNGNGTYTWIDGSGITFNIEYFTDSSIVGNGSSTSPWSVNFETLCDFPEITDQVDDEDFMVSCNENGIGIRNTIETISSTFLNLLSDPVFADAVFDLLAQTADTQFVPGRSYWVTIPSGPGPIVDPSPTGSYGATYHILGPWGNSGTPLQGLEERICTTKSGKYEITTRVHLDTAPQSDKLTLVQFAYALYDSSNTLIDLFPAEFRDTSEVDGVQVYNFSRTSPLTAGQCIVPLIYGETLNGGDLRVSFVRHSFSKSLST